jgi:tetratricopeptide (TPR) repeat protein/transcriptional regulator with XRE-family HTH domain
MRNNEKVLPNELLQHERERHNWSREYVAQQVSAPEVRMVGRWEREGVLPHPDYRQRLCELFSKSARELGFVKAGEVPFWNIPYPRNPFFTGRETILTSLHTFLVSDKSAVLTQPQAICGLGGVGKTQVALEYAYRYAHEYQAVFWVGAETSEILMSNFVALANLLNLKEKDEKDQSTAVDAVKRWLTALSRWLLILDNVDDLQVIADFLPPAVKGHVFLTTRMQATGKIAHRVEVDAMEPEEGALFLLRRAKLFELDAPLDVSYASWTQARAIAQAMGGLPLALDQAGAYIEETKCGLDAYLTRYQTLGVALLHERGETASDHPAEVVGTFLLSLEKVEQANPAAADLLRLCAFLAPDAIPEEIITKGAAELGSVLESVAVDSFKLDKAIKQLLRYSLVRRNRDTKTLTIHRLVQAVVKNEMFKDTQRQWAERAVRAVNLVFPEVEYKTWPLCQRYLSHSRVCAELIEHWDMISLEAARLINQAGIYSYERGQYKEAEPLLQRAVANREQLLGSNHPDVARTLYYLAELYGTQGKYQEAEALHQRVLMIREQVFGKEHQEVAQSLMNLAWLYYAQAKYDEAEPLMQRVLDMRKKVLGPTHPDVAHSLSHLATLYTSQGKYEQAEPLLLLALDIQGQEPGPTHLDMALSLNNLASLYEDQGKYEQAEPLYRRALMIREQALGPDHPDVAQILNGMALLYLGQGQYQEAEPLLHRTIAIYEHELGPDHPHTAVGLNNLVKVYNAQGKYAQAEPVIQRALAIYELRLGPDHLYVAAALNPLAQIYLEQGKYEQAESLLQRALVIQEQVLGPTHPKIAITLEIYIRLLHKTNRQTEAIQLEERLKIIRAE